MTTTLSIEDRLEQLGVLIGNEDTKIQRTGADLITKFFTEYQIGSDVDVETSTLVLHYLTDIQVRDFAMGLLDPEDAERQAEMLQVLFDAAPDESDFINAPATLMSILYYEQNRVADAVLILTRASTQYSLAQLLMRVYRAGWNPELFAAMREELHPKVAAGIYGS